MKSFRLLALVTCLLPFATQAADRLDTHVSVLTDYVYRGISMTDNKAAVQAGLEYRRSDGPYIGAIVSNVDLPSGSDLEGTFYLGFAGEIKEANFGWSIGADAYRYNESDDNIEDVYLQIAFDIWPERFKVLLGGYYEWDPKNVIGEAALQFDIGSGVKFTANPGVVDYDDNTVVEDYRWLKLSLSKTFTFDSPLRAVDVEVAYSDTDLERGDGSVIGEAPAYLITDRNETRVQKIWWLGVTARF